MNQLEDLQDWVKPLLEKLEPGQRRKLSRSIGQQLRKSQRARIASQKNPDGSPFEPRKPQARSQRGSVRRSKMFMKIRQAKHMKLSLYQDSAAVGFLGGVSFVARVHQFGLREPVRKGGDPYKFPERELLGFSDEDRELVRNLLIDHLT